MTTTEPRTSWEDADLPDTHDQWVARAAEVGEILAADVADRDRAGEAPFGAVKLLKDSGLVTMLGPRAEGGGGANWATAYADSDGNPTEQRVFGLAATDSPGMPDSGRDN